MSETPLRESYVVYYIIYNEIEFTLLGNIKGTLSYTTLNKNSSDA